MISQSNQTGQYVKEYAKDACMFLFDVLVSRTSFSLRAAGQSAGDSRRSRSLLRGSCNFCTVSGDVAGPQDGWGEVTPQDVSAAPDPGHAALATNMWVMYSGNMELFNM